MAYTYKPYEKKEYQQGSSVTDAQKKLQQHQGNKPGAYQSAYQPNLDKLMDQIQNRGPFQYDANADAMYQQMVDRYVQMGRQGMMDTMGQAATLTGGYGNSYAQTAGQQTYQNYLQGANDMLPQFYQMALDRYNSEGDRLTQQYGLLSDRENTAYSRYLDQLNQYNAELARLQTAYDNERQLDYSRWADDQSFGYRQWANDRDFGYSQYQDELNRQYQQGRDEISDQRWKDQWDYQQGRDKISDEQWQKEFDESVRRYNFENKLGEFAVTGGHEEEEPRRSVDRNPTVSEDDKKAMDFVENMLNNAGSSRLNPERVISGSSYLTPEQKKTAQEYLDKIIGSGAMKR